MTLKERDNLPSSKRRQLVNTFYNNMSDELKETIAQEFHHNFAWRGKGYQDGYWYELLLKHCKLKKMMARL